MKSKQNPLQRTGGGGWGRHGRRVDGSGPRLVGAADVVVGVPAAAQQVGAGDVDRVLFACQEGGRSRRTSLVHGNLPSRNKLMAVIHWRVPLEPLDQGGCRDSMKIAYTLKLVKYLVDVS